MCEGASGVSPHSPAGSLESLRALGFCRRCGVVHSLGADSAIQAAKYLQVELARRRSIEIPWPPPLESFDASVASDLSPPANLAEFGVADPGSSDAVYSAKTDPSDPWSTDWLYKHLGQMFGVLHCRDAQGRDVWLRAFSYQHNGHWHAPGWEDPVFDTAAYDRAIEEGNLSLHPLTDAIEALKAEQERRGWAPRGRGSARMLPGEKPEERTERLELDARLRSLKTMRREVSHQVMEKMHALYLLRSRSGEEVRLSEAWTGSGGIPMGTGDCCAPKLLVAAARKGLTPVALAEFYWGKPTPSGERHEGHFYAACERRCQPILGFLLCDVPGAQVATDSPSTKQIQKVSLETNSGAEV